MSGGAAAPRVGVVDDVVVHEGGGVEDLQCSRYREHVLGRRYSFAGVLANCAPPGKAEAGAQTLSAANGLGGGAVEEDRLIAEELDLGLPCCQEVLDSLRNCRDRITTY